MEYKRLLLHLIGLTLVLVLLVACGTPDASPTPIPSTSTSTYTPTPVPPTATFTPKPPTATPTPVTPTLTPTETPIPGVIVNGRVYLINQDEPVLTTVYLVRRENDKDVSTEEIGTDEDGYYSFLVEEPGTYVIRVSVTNLLNKCNKLWTESGWPIKVQTFDTQGVLDTLAQSNPLTITLDDDITLDCELNCE